MAEHRGDADSGQAGHLFRGGGFATPAEDLFGGVQDAAAVVSRINTLCAPAWGTRDELREHFTPTDASPRLHRRPANITVHETTDPEVIVAEFEYQGTIADTGEPFAQPAIFVLRVRNGEIVESRDYFDHLSTAHVRGQLSALVAAVETAAQ
jgi:ketosteroid isomerase-like protein